MRNWTIIITAIALTCGSAWAETSAGYKTIKELCLFSPFLAPAESPIALRTLNIFGDTTDDFDDFATSLASSDLESFRFPANAVAPAVSPLNRLYVVLPGGDWRSAAGGASERILGAGADGTAFAWSAGDRTADANMTFGLSSVRAVGLEHNGFVAGFNLKFY